MHTFSFSGPRLRVMAYNILHGGKGVTESADRLPLIARVINNAAPEVLAIQEANWWDTNDRLFELGEATGLHWRRLGSATPAHRHLALFSRGPLMHLSNHPEGMRTTIMRALIPWKAGGPFWIFVIHLSSVSENVRLRELDVLLGHLQGFDRALIVGDFNSLSPDDLYDREALLGTFQNTGLRKFGTRALRFDVITRLLEEGFVDLKPTGSNGERVVYTVPTASSTDKAHATRLRLDYAFATPSVAAQSAGVWVQYEDPADSASDHYPLVIDLAV